MPDGPGLGEVNSESLPGEDFSPEPFSAPSLLPLPLKRPENQYKRLFEIYHSRVREPKRYFWFVFMIHIPLYLLFFRQHRDLINFYVTQLKHAILIK